MYVATRGLYSMKPPTIFVPTSIKENVEKLFEVHREMDQSQLNNNLVGLNVGKVPSHLNFTEFLLVGSLHFVHMIAYALCFFRRRVSDKEGPQSESFSNIPWYT